METTLPGASSTSSFSASRLFEYSGPALAKQTERGAAEQKDPSWFLSYSEVAHDLRTGQATVLFQKSEEIKLYSRTEGFKVDVAGHDQVELLGLPPHKDSLDDMRHSKRVCAAPDSCQGATNRVDDLHPVLGNTQLPDRWQS